MRSLFHQLLVTAACIGLPGVLLAQAKVDEALPVYAKTSGVSGNLSSVGSDTMNNLMQLWNEGLTTIYPNINPAMEGKGS